jgi:hypothetical protein
MVLLVSHALGLLHLGLQPHVLSLATGAVLHQDPPRSDAGHPRGPTDRDGHHECKIVAALTQAAVLPCVAVVEPDARVLTDVVPAAKESQVTEGRARLYLLSPSQSPPRA